MSKRHVHVSKLLSFGLRHDPDALGIVLDVAGWTDVSDLIAALEGRGEKVDLTELQEIVRTSDKQRFAFSDDGSRIRANQGHSVKVDLGLVPTEPPRILYHGTIDRFVGGIRAEGLLRGTRAHVHLSADESTAFTVARRRRGEAVVIVVDAARMHADGLSFFRSENGVWLAEHVPHRYLTFPSP